MKRAFLSMGTFLAAHKGWAATVVGGASALPALAVGTDPWPWAIGFGGGAFLYLMRDPGTRKALLGNTMLSLILGGVVAPAVALVLEKQFPVLHVDGLDYVVATALGWGWPWLIELAVPLLKKRMGENT